MVPLKLTKNKQVLDSTKMSKQAEETTYEERSSHVKRSSIGPCAM